MTTAKGPVEGIDVLIIGKENGNLVLGGRNVSSDGAKDKKRSSGEGTSVCTPCAVERVDDVRILLFELDNFDPTSGELISSYKLIENDGKKYLTLILNKESD